MNKLIIAQRLAAASLAILTCLAVTSPVSAQPYPGPYGAHGYGYHPVGPYHHRVFGPYGGAAVAGGVIAGAAIGAAIASRPPVVYVAPPPSVVYVRPAPPIVYAAPPPVMLYTR